jgi:hypothetical protein
MESRTPYDLKRVTNRSSTFNAVPFIFSIYSENLADLFFLLLRHKFSRIAYVRLVNFNAEKRKKKGQKVQKPRCFEYIPLKS